MMEAFAEFLEMGGYGAFIWPAYLATAAIMIGLAVRTRRWIRRSEALVEDLEAYRRHAAGTATSDEA